jgi:seryl-tRNA synthetase
MIDTKHLKANPDMYKDSARRRGISVSVDTLLTLEAERGLLLQEVEALRAQLNVKGKPTPKQLATLQDAKTQLAASEVKLSKVDTEYTDLLWQMPNLMPEDTPDGGEESNLTIKQWGETTERDFQVSDHTSYSEAHDLLDFERGTKVAGAKFLFSKGATIRLQMSVMRMAMDMLQEAGFVLMGVPHMVNSRVAAGSGYLPRGEERQIYKIEGEDLNLIATSEIAITGYHADEIIDSEKLPLVYAGISPCYRMEAGAYGKHSRGYYRVHQFDKLEMYIFCKPEDSASWHERILAIEEEITQKLEIPYRIIRIAAGDLGAPAYKKFDLEYWSPIDGEYRELTSCSNCTDYQARRLAIRTRDNDGRTMPVHTLNGTAIAFSRTFIALIENHQTADGGVRIPKALQPYYGGTTL